MTRRGLAGVLAGWVLAGCDASGTVNGDVRTALATTLRVSLSARESEGDRDVAWAQLSGDGHALAFSSAATNLHADYVGEGSGVYVKDLRTRDLYLASRRSGAVGTVPPSTPFSSQIVGLSRSGRRVVFSTPAPLDALDTDALEDIYVRDLDSHETILVSRASGALGAKGNQRSSFPVISGDGRYVAFASEASNLDPADTDVSSHVFLRDVDAGMTELISRASGASGVKADGGSLPMAVCDGGSRVVFFSQASNLWTIPLPLSLHMYVRDRASPPRTLLVSRAAGSGGAPGDQVSFSAAMTADGFLVAFSSRSTNLHPEDADAQTDIFLRDLRDDSLELVSRSTGASGAKGIGNSAQSGVALSLDGRFVAFSSDSANLVPGDTNGLEDVFVRDRVLSATARVSVRTFGSQIGKACLRPGLSDDGGAVLFLSAAPDIVQDDSNGFVDAFVRSPLR